ncbi:unnamed protein product [Anisakis simplex]|uniref:Uncharacterized protein n=1 Tax=Anisakis simplex TaxID=6269 RepID=A0A0M3J1H0_ANISI|nr:unnamed protein product [Anisakis simplex]
MKCFRFRAQRKLERRLKTINRPGFESSLDPDTYWSLPFNQLIHQKRSFIGCHKLYGTVTFVP